MTPVTTQVINLIVPPVLWFFFIGGIFSMAIGIGLICFSSRVYQLFDRMNRWVSFRQVSKPMAIPRDSWPFMERNRRWIALVFIVASLLSIANLLWRLDAAALAGMAGLASVKYHVPRAFAIWLITSAWWFLLIGSGVAALVGVGLGFFPQTVKRVEQWPGLWFSPRNMTKGAETQYTPLDKLALTHPRWLGTIIVVVALGNVIAIGHRLF